MSCMERWIKLLSVKLKQSYDLPPIPLMLVSNFVPKYTVSQFVKITEK